ncbi:MAG: hypothetical protein ACD_75C00519G0002 [uncultured bacterium]|nr:MAG: hypothetical protein ACD_75C00519G0002 [uncultured bacterium]
MAGLPAICGFCGLIPRIIDNFADPYLVVFVLQYGIDHPSPQAVPLVRVMAEMGKGRGGRVKDVQAGGGTDPDLAGPVAGNGPDTVRAYGVVVVRPGDERGEKVAFLVVTKESFP